MVDTLKDWEVQIIKNGYICFLITVMFLRITVITNKKIFIHDKVVHTINISVFKC